MQQHPGCVFQLHNAVFRNYQESSHPVNPVHPCSDSSPLTDQGEYQDHHEKLVSSPAICLDKMGLNPYNCQCLGD
jgi:hypothetical protein